MTAAEFDRATPREVQWRIDAHTERQYKALEESAQLACWLLSPLVGKALTVKDLIRRPGDASKFDWSAFMKG